MKKFLPKTKSNSQGFTLVELLVVITIIAILSVIGMAVFTGVQKNARDSRRKADIDAMSKAMEAQYDQTTGQYKTSLLTTYFSTGIVPTDPQGASYTTGTITTAGFVFCASLESSTGNASSNTGGAVSGGNNGYYCMRNAQ